MTPDYINAALLDALIQAIEHTDAFKKSALPRNHQNWKRSNMRDFEQFSKDQLEQLLSHEQIILLGNRIQVSTTYRIVKKQYKIKAPLDKRKLANLDKLSILAGYTNWWHFVQTHRQELQKKQLITVIKDAINAEFTAYQKLPETLDLSLLSPYFIENQSAYNRIKDVLIRVQQHSWTISNPNNPSTYELLSCSIENVSANEAILHTKEYFHIRWYNAKDCSLQYIYNEINEQVYVLNLHNGHWKVRTNYYPSPDNSPLQI